MTRYLCPNPTLDASGIRAGQVWIHSDGGEYRIISGPDEDAECSLERVGGSGPKSRVASVGTLLANWDCTSVP